MASDILDDKAAKAMAWTRTIPRLDRDEVDDDEDEEPQDAASAETRLAVDRERVEEAARAVERVWSIADPSVQVRETAGLARAVSRLSFALAGEGGSTFVRLTRLLVRHYRALPREARKGAFFSLSWSTLDGPELPALLAETARLADPWASLMIERAALKDGMHVRCPGLGAALCAVLDDPTVSYEPKRLAMRWLSYGDYPAAARSLRPWLRSRYYSLRWIALWILLDLREAHPELETLNAADVLWLLEDAVVHPLPTRVLRDRAFGDTREYEETLLRATRLLRPPGGEVPISKMARGETEHYAKCRDHLDREWAIRALAAAYPSSAYAEVDLGLADASRYTRAPAAQALRDLCWQQAEPRLRRAAADPSPEVADVAREIFEAKAGRPLVIDALAGLPVHLLDAPPSERMLERAGILRRLSDDRAREKMALVLLREAPDREALVLTLFNLAEGHVWFADLRGVPKQDAWMRALVRRWGEAGARGAIWLARERPTGNGTCTHAFEHVLRGAVGRAVRDDVRALGLELLADERTRSAGAFVLVASGVGPNDWPPVLAEVLRGDTHVDLALHRGRMPGLDDAVARELEHAIARGAEQVVIRLGLLGERRKSRAVKAVLARRARAHDASSTVISFAGSSGLLDDAWRAEALAHPEWPAFDGACDQIPGRDPTAHEEALLRAAMSSSARDGRARAVAISALVRAKRIAEGPELAGLLDATPPNVAHEIVDGMGVELDPELLWPTFERVMRTGDVTGQRAMLDVTFTSLRENGWYERIEALVGTLPEGLAREVLANRIRAPSATMRYWRDPEEHPGDDEQDEEGGDED